jgi:hypothetical protein
MSLALFTKFVSERRRQEQLHQLLKDKPGQPHLIPML